MKHRNGIGPALEPETDATGWESMVGSIMASADFELRRRRRDVTLTGTLLAWARPALSAAATVALLLSAAAVLDFASPVDPTEAAEPSVASALVPEAVAAWLIAGYEPTVAEVVLALEEEVR